MQTTNVKCSAQLALPFSSSFSIFTSPSVDSTRKETQNDSEKLQRDQLSKGIGNLKSREKDLLEFVKRNEALDPEKAEKLKTDAKVRWAMSLPALLDFNFFSLNRNFARQLIDGLTTFPN